MYALLARLEQEAHTLSGNGCTSATLTRFTFRFEYSHMRPKRRPSPDTGPAGAVCKSSKLLMFGRCRDSPRLQANLTPHSIANIFIHCIAVCKNSATTNLFHKALLANSFQVAERNQWPARALQMTIIFHPLSAEATSLILKAVAIP